MTSGGLTYRPANRRKRPLWAEFIFALDRWLRRRQGVFEYTHDPECIFRIQLQRLRSEVVLSDGTFGRPGDQAIDLHLWNEQIPAVPVAGPSLAWGRRFNLCFAAAIHVSCVPSLPLRAHAICSLSVLHNRHHVALIGVIVLNWRR